MTYNPFRDSLKQAAKDNNMPVSQLIALTASNDPFYVGSPAQIKQGEWFAKHWNNRKAKLQAEGITDFRANMRGIHYNFQSTNAIVLPNTVSWSEEINGVKVKKSTDIYINNNACWKFLCAAAKYARYLGLVPPELFYDAKAGELIQNMPYEDDTQKENKKIRAQIRGGWHTEPDPYAWPRDDKDNYQLPELPELESLPYSLPQRPMLMATGFHTDQKYVIEIWCEKSSVVKPIENFCKDKQINMVVGAGELSITACLQFIKRVQEYDKPVMILYVSDYDPAGYAMSMSVSRKIEYFIRTHDTDNSVNVKVVPVILTPQQIAEYQLPTVPAKQSDNRFDKWNNVHGDNVVVELDSLEALYPRILESLLSSYVDNYIDPDYSQTVYHERNKYDYNLQDASEHVREEFEVIDQLEQEYNDLHSEWEDTKEEFAKFIEPFQDKIDVFKERLEYILIRTKEAHDKMTEELTQVSHNVPLPEQPKHNLPNENLDVKLFDSERTYEEQMNYYNARKNNTPLDQV